MGKFLQLALLCATLQLTFMLASSTSSSHSGLTSYYKTKYYCWHKQQVWCRYPAYVQLKDNRCSCVCKTGLTWDAKAKRCICPRPGQYYNPKSKQCVCPSCQRWDSATKTCVCRIPGQVYEKRWRKCVCPRPLVLAKDRKSCVCPYPGQVFDSKQNRCSCPGDLTLSSSKRCECPPCEPNEKLVQKGDQCECVCDRKCTGRFVLDSDACKCVCPEGLVFNPKTKECDCPYRGQVYTSNGCVCPGDLELDTKAGACVCPTCPDYYRLQQTGDQCECVCDRKCTGRFVLDSDACECVCPEGLVFNPKTKECDCPYRGQVYTSDGCVCPGDLELDTKAGACVCPTCPDYYRLQQTGDQCECVCDRKCTGRFVLDSDACECVCPEGLTFNPKTKQCECPEGQRPDPKTNTCVCPLKYQFYTEEDGCVCPKGLVPNPKTSSCVCPPCPRNYRWEQRGTECNCICDIKCHGLAILNRDTCQCECPTGLVLDSSGRTCVCPKGLVLHPTTQKCICPGDLVFNSETGSCECPTCPKGYTSSRSGDQCECQCNIKCEQPLVRSDSSCECLCPKGTTLDAATNKCVCPEGQHYNPYTGQCQCNGDKVLNSDTGRCECSACPHAGYTSIEKDDSCKCICTVLCGEGRVRNEAECRCEEPTTSPPSCRCKSKVPHPLHSLGCSKLSQKDCETHGSYQCKYVCY